MTKSRAASRGGSCVGCIATAIVVVAALPGPVAGDQVSLTAVKDNTLFSSATGGLSSGAGPFLFVGQSGGQVGDPIQHRALLAFDVSSIPAGSTITSATVTLTLLQASPFGGDDLLRLRRVSTNWGEGTSIAFGGMGAPSTPGDATWLHTFYSNQFWASAGGDYVGPISASLTVGTTPGPYVWGSTATMVTQVQLWLDNPATNFGWVLVGNETTLFSAKKFYSREGEPGTLPQLVVTFDPPPCPWDCDGSNDGNTNVADLLALLGQYDPDAPGICAGGGSCDYDGNGCVDVVDLLKLLAHYTTDPGGIGCP